MKVNERGTEESKESLESLGEDSKRIREVVTPRKRREKKSKSCLLKAAKRATTWKRPTHKESVKISPNEGPFESMASLLL